MTQWIALLRGINVGGNNILPMKDLRDLLTSEGFEGVKTYIQSGNCVFASAQSDPQLIEQIMAQSIELTFGFCPQIMVLNAKEFLQAVASNPFPEGQEDPKSVHLFFLSERAARPDMSALEGLRSPTERFELTDRVFYLQAPDGIGRSKLASHAERKLGVATTARNLRSANKIAELLG